MTDLKVTAFLHQQLFSSSNQWPNFAIPPIPEAAVNKADLSRLI